MIFRTIDQINLSADNAFFEELVEIYCKIVREICSKYNYVFVDTVIEPSGLVLKELIDMGIIADEQQISLLKKRMKDYDTFIWSVDFAVSHPELFGNLLDKLNNKKRKEIQQRENKANKPTIADFFAGAGGLSLGFIQSGFHVIFANDFEEVCVNTYRYNHPETAGADCFRTANLLLLHL